MNASWNGDSATPPLEPLTRREQEILDLLAEGLTSSEMAERLTLAVSSVRWYVQQIYGKLGVNGKRQAIARASQLGLLQPGVAIPAPNQPALKPERSLPSGIVTFLFTDIEGSTPLWERMPTAMREAVAQHHALLRQMIEANHGQVYQIIGDSFQSAFRLTANALHAALAVQRALHDSQWGQTGPLNVRMGVHTGPAELDPLGNAPYAVNHTLNRAARIMSAAHGGQVLLSQEACDLVARELPDGVTLTDLGEHYLKGMLSPEHLFQAAAPGLPVEFPPLRSERRPSHNLPLELTSFIGRQAEIVQVQSLLKEHRLVTLTGSGGVGKTRLSIQVAGQLLAEAPDGVWYVELAPIADSALVPQTVATTLGLRGEPNRPILETLAFFLGNRELMLVLDNCEHVLPACAELADALLRKAPGLRILTSSREALGIAGEFTFRVPSLSAPDPQQVLSPLGMQTHEAVQLFVARAQAVLPGFALHEDNAPAVAAICRRLDGIPLALELAAARLTLLTPEQLASRLDHAFRLLTGGSRTALPRQQTLRATIDWSYRLLSTEEQILLRRLAVFAGGGTLVGIESICAGEGVEAEQILDLLNGLVNKSMVIAERKQPGEMRYPLLETVRQYAREKLYDSGEIERLRNQHLDYYVALCEEANPHIHGAERPEWTRRLKGELDNIREALEWAFHDSTLALQGLRIATAITDRFLEMLGLFGEATRWLNAGLQAAGDQIPKLMKAKVLYNLSTAWIPSELAHITSEQCIALCREIGLQANRELCLTLAHNYTSDFEYSLPREVEAVRIAREMGPAGTWELGETLFYYAQVLCMHPQGAYDDQALAAVEEFHQVIQSGDRWYGIGYYIIGIIQTLRGQCEQAQQSLESALKISNEIDDYIGILFSLFLLAWHHRLAGHYSLSLQYCQKLFACADAVADVNGYALFAYSTGMVLVNRLNDPLFKENSLAGQGAVRLISFGSQCLDENGWDYYIRLKPIDLRAVELLRHKLGEEVFSRAWMEGQKMGLEEALAMALAIEI